MNRPARTLVLADAHLRGPADPRQAEVLAFLHRWESRCDELVLLGDFFEFLAGDNRAAAAAYRPVLEQLGRFTRLEIVEGNHDFDLSCRLPGLARARIHPGPVDLSLCGWRCRLLHGDRTLDADRQTRALRAVLQSGPLRLIRDHLLPDGLIFRFALAFAEYSRRRPRTGRAGGLEAIHSRAEAELSRSGADAVLFAHTHASLMQPCEAGLVANPGAAEPGGSFIQVRVDRIQLCRFPDGESLAEYLKPQ